MNQSKGKVATTTGTNKNAEERGRADEEPREYTGTKPNVNKSRVYLIYTVPIFLLQIPSKLNQNDVT